MNPVSVGMLENNWRRMGGKEEREKGGREKKKGREIIPSVEESSPIRLQTPGYNILKNWFFSKSNQNLNSNKRAPI
jgi:hypothetical protein